MSAPISTTQTPEAHAELVQRIAALIAEYDDYGCDEVLCMTVADDLRALLARC